MALQDTIDLFNKVNQDCEQTGELVIPFAKNYDIVDYYMHQMANLGMSQQDMIEFKTFLQSQPYLPMESFGINQ